MSFTTLLPERAVIRLSGEDVAGWLQGLLTQDMRLLATQPLVFTAMLSAQGKVLWDGFIHRADEADTLYLEMDARFAEEAMTTLSRYRLRRAIDIVRMPEMNVAVCSALPTDISGIDWHQDPRMPALGWRALTQQPDLPSTPDIYRLHCLNQGVADAAQDGNGRFFLAEFGYEPLNAVSFNKGCFVGQEPTARMHYRKTLRKCLLPVSAAMPLPPAETPVVAGDVVIGELRASLSHAGDHCGMALIRYGEWQAQQGAAITAGGEAITIHWPDYWHGHEAAFAAAQDSAQAGA